jgi:hypothetical protein
MWAARNLADRAGQHDDTAALENGLLRGHGIPEGMLLQTHLQILGALVVGVAAAR